MISDSETIEQAKDFHGHMCPGLAIGIQASRIALREIGPHSKDEEVVAVVENDMCGIDAIQFMMGCTFGKGNLIHRDWGKNAYSFYRRSDGRAIRIALRATGWVRDPARLDLFEKARLGQASETDLVHLRELNQTESQSLLEMAPDDLFKFDEIESQPPGTARILSSVTCEQCGEATMETRIRKFEGRELCQPCYEEATRRP